jgi:hypothetical protein
MKRNDYTIYHIAHAEYLRKHPLKCHLLPDEKVFLFDGTGFESFSKAINTCITNCPTEIIIIFSHKVYPFPDEIDKILSYIDQGYAFVAPFRFAFFALKKDLIRKIGFLDERFIPGGGEDEDFFIRLKEANYGMIVSHESMYGREKSAWRFSHIDGPAKHLDNKWKKRRERNLSEEKYNYDLGPSTNQKYLPWDQSKISQEAINIYDPILTKYPYYLNHDITRYTIINKFLATRLSSTEINQLPQIQEKTYLELGVGNKVNFDLVKCKNKICVDINSSCNPTYVMTTDEYFEKFKNDKFDIIYVDANHDFDYALRDLNNSFIRCEKFVMIHDMVPPNINYTAKNRCSDSYKILYYLLKETNLEILTLNTNYGLTFIKMPAQQIDIPETYKNITFEEFNEFMESQTTYSSQEIVKILETWI